MKESVHNALEALKTLISEQKLCEDDAALLQKLAPSLAVRLEQSGADIDVASLVAHLEKGASHVSAQIKNLKGSPQSKRTYKDVIKAMHARDRALMEQKEVQKEAQSQSIKELSRYEQLMQYIQNGDVEKFTLLLEEDRGIGYSKLFVAALEHQQVEIVKYFIDNNKEDGCANALYGRLLADNATNDICAYFLQSIACPEERVKSAGRILVHACISNKPNIVRYAWSQHLQDGLLTPEMQETCETQAFHHAIENGHVAVTRFLIENGRYFEQHKNAYLLLAARRGQRKVMRLILAENADMDAAITLSNGSDESAVVCAFQKGHFGVVKDLIAKGAQYNKEDFLAGCITRHNFKMADYFIARGADPENHIESITQSAHFLARLDVLEKYVNFESLAARPEIVAKMVRSALHYKCLHVLDDLIRRGIDFEITPKHIEEAIYYHRTDIFKFLIKNNYVTAQQPALLDKLLSKTIENEEWDFAKLLIAKGADIRSNNDQFILRAAAQKQWKLVKYAVKKGADIRASNDQALQEAVYAGSWDMVKYLVKHKANIHVEDDWALRKAAEQEQWKLVKYLAANGANINAGNGVALRCAVKSGQWSLMCELVDRGADIRVSNDSAVRIAISLQDDKFLKYLTEKGANLRVNDSCVLSKAAEDVRWNLIPYLIEHGAKISDCPNIMLPIAAIRGGRLDMLELFLENGAYKQKHEYEMLLCALKENQHEIMAFLQNKFPDCPAFTGHSLYESLRHVDVKMLKISADQIDEEELYSMRNLDMLSAHHNWPVAQYLIDNDVKGRFDTDYVAKVQKKIDCVNKWKKLHPEFDCPKHIETANPSYFKMNAYHEVYAMFEDEVKEAIGRVNPAYCYMLSALFGSGERVLQYLDKWGRLGSHSGALHDCAQGISIPHADGVDMKAWGDAVLKHGPKMARLLQFAEHIPQPLKSSDGKSWSYTETNKEVAKHVYKQGAENQELAQLAYQFKWNEKHFERGLALAEEYAQRFGANDNPKDLQRIPDVTLDGSLFDKPKYNFRKLEDGDLRGLFLGEYTDCCQHLANQGAPCAEHGFLSENGGFYVVEDKETRNVVAQSWAWRGRNGELVFDSLESLRGHFDAAQWKSLFSHFCDAVRGQDTDIRAIHIGGSGGTPRLGYKWADKLAKPVDYQSYRDSDKRQYVLTL